MKLFVCESGGHHVAVAAADADRAREICALAEIEALGLGRKLGEEAVAENVREFVGGWSAKELVLSDAEGIRVAWWDEGALAHWLPEDLEDDL